MCQECYTRENRRTPLFNPLDCLESHSQYICGTCGRCIALKKIQREDCKGGISPLNR